MSAKLLYFLATFLTFIAHYNCYGQVVKCKYEVNEFDSFSGMRIVKTKFQSVGNPDKTWYDVKASVRKVDSTYFLLVTGIARSCVSNHDTEVSFKTPNGEIYSLKHIGEIDCGRTVYVGAASAESQPMIYLRVDTEEIRKYAISMIRITQGQVYMNVTITTPMTFKQLFDCADNAPMAKRKP
jgi:hypothetical protein